MAPININDIVKNQKDDCIKPETEQTFNLLPIHFQSRLSNFRQQKLDDVIYILKEIRSCIPDKFDNIQESFMRLDEFLISLVKLNRKMDDFLGPYPVTSEESEPFDLLITDIKPDDLPKRISEVLGVQYLAPASDNKWPCFGKIIKTYSKCRVLFSIPVSGRQKSVFAHFIFDTGSPRTYIAKSVIDALGIPEASLYGEIIRINGVKTDISISDSQKTSFHTPDGTLHESPCRFSGLNILGIDLLDRLDAHLSINMKEMNAKIDLQRT